MDTYLLALMVTFEQEYAIQKLFGRHGWEYTKITDETLLRNLDPAKSTASEVSKSSEQPLVNNQVPVNIRNTPALSQVSEANETSVKGAEVNDATNTLDSGINSGDAHEFDGNDDVDDFDGDTDTEQSFEKLGIIVKEEAETESDNGDNLVSAGKNIRKTKKSRARKRVANTKSKTVIPKRRREANTTVVTEQESKSDSDVKMEKMSSENQQDDDPLAVLEVLSNVEHVSKIMSSDTDDSEGFSKGPADLDDSGYSATLALFFCKDCSYTFPERKYYILHKRDGKCVFACQFCNEKYTFKNFSKYQEHLKQHRSTETQVKVEHSHLCRTCGKSFCYKRNLYTHENRHAGTLPFHCCGKSFASRHDLQRHRCSVHGEDKLFSCSMCQKKFSTKSDLNEHERNERNEKKFSCEVCGLKADKYSRMISHMATHSKEKQKRCRICHAAFKHSSSLTRHMKQKHS